MKMFGMDTLDWRQVFIDWDAITEDVILAGTPMNKDGRMANDGTVYGILMDDVQRKRNKQGRVVISGVIDLEACEKHSGITLSGACKAALPDVWSQTGGGGSGGVTSWNDLTDRPFGEEQGLVEVLPEITVALDGGNGFLATIPPLVIGENYTVNWNGTKYSCVAQDMSAVALGAVAIGNLKDFGVADTGEPFVIAVFPGENTSLFSFEGLSAVTVSIVGNGNVIKTLDPKFLPGGSAVELYGDYDLVINTNKDSMHIDSNSIIEKGNFESCAQAMGEKGRIKIIVRKNGGGHYAEPIYVMFRNDDNKRVSFCYFDVENGYIYECGMNSENKLSSSANYTVNVID